MLSIIYKTRLSETKLLLPLTKQTDVYKVQDSDLLNVSDFNIRNVRLKTWAKAKQNTVVLGLE